MSQTREKWDFLVLSRGDFEVIRKCHSISCFHFCFLFRNNGKRQQVGENGFRRCYDNFFSKVLFLKYFITIMFTVLSQQLWRLQCLQQLKQLPRQLHLKDTLRLNILWKWINTGVDMYQDIWLIIVCFSISQISLVFRFNLVFIERFSLKFIQYLYVFL